MASFKSALERGITAFKNLFTDLSTGIHHTGEPLCFRAFCGVDAVIETVIANRAVVPVGREVGAGFTGAKPPTSRTLYTSFWII